MSLMRDELIRVLSPKIRFANTEVSSDNIPAYCPFHKDGNETTPSFYLYVGERRSQSQSPGAAYCAACGTGWSFPTLLKRLGISRDYVDAVNEIFYEKAKRTPGYYDEISFELPHLAERVLYPYDYAPKLMLEQFDKALLKEFDIGFDRRSSRITFPIRDHHGTLVGVSGRTVLGEHPRYKIYKSELAGNSPNYELKKARVVWGLHRFYQTAMHGTLDTPLVVCEGFKAAMWVVHSGLDSAVALMGDACSETQALLLRRVTNDIVLFLDDDKAGRAATRRVKKKLAGGVDVRVVSYPRPELQESPDDLTEEEVLTAIIEAR